MRTRATIHAVVARAAALAAVVASLVAGPVPAQTDVLWRHTISKTIKLTTLDAKGHLLVFTDGGITALDPDSVSQAWQYSTGESIKYFNSLWTGSLLVGAGGTLAAIDPGTGQPAWRRTNLPDITKTWIDIDDGDWSAILQTGNGFAVLDLHTGPRCGTPPLSRRKRWCGSSCGSGTSTSSC